MQPKTSTQTTATRWDLQMFAEGAGESDASANGADFGETAGETETGQSEENGGFDGGERSENSQKGGESAESGADGAENARSENTREGRMSDINILRSVQCALEERRMNAQIEETIRSWENQAEQMQTVYPEFELAKEVQNPEFARLLKAGVPLRQAYEAANLDTIIASVIRFCTAEAKRTAVEEFLKHKERPRENGVSERATSVRHTDVHSLSQKDIMRILGEVSRGAKISFN